MNEPRAMLVEFASLVALVVGAAVGAVALQVWGAGDAPIALALLDIVKVGFGAILALAYAARGVPAVRTETTTTPGGQVHTTVAASEAPKP